MALLAYGTLAGGTLTGKVRPQKQQQQQQQASEQGREAPDEASGGGGGGEGGGDAAVVVAPAQSRHALFPHFQPRYYSAGTLAAAADYAALAAELELTPTQLALVWSRQREYMGAVIIGATTLEQLRENILAFDLPDLSPQVLRRMDAIDERLAAAYYRGVQPGVVQAEAEAEVETDGVLVN